MALTLGSGPLADDPAGALNFDLTATAPKHRIVFEPFAPRVRAVVGGATVLDTTRAQLLHETAHLPVVYAPFDDYAMDLFTASDTSTHCPYKGDASYYTLRVGDRDVDDALWHYPEPVDSAPFLDGVAALYHDKVDAWFVESERVVGHIRDPYHRVDVYDSTRPATVRVNGTVVASSDHPKLLAETALPMRVYVPADDVVPDAVRPGSGKRTHCPYKGEASYWTVAGVEDVAWSYESPLPEAIATRTHLCFDESIDGVEVTLG